VWYFPQREDGSVLIVRLYSLCGGRNYGVLRSFWQKAEGETPQIDTLPGCVSATLCVIRARIALLSGGPQ